MDAMNPGLFNFDFLDAISDDKDGNEKIMTCVQCGSCAASCVAAEGMAISPRKLWRGLRMGMETRTMDSMSYWNCTTCGLCDKRCPRGIPMSQIMLSLREKYDQNGGAISGVEQTLENLKKSGNITGDDPENRFLWLDNLSLSGSDRRKLFRERAKVVYFTGCVSALFPQVGGIAQSLTKLLLRIEADFSLLEDEICCGYPVMAGGKGVENVEYYAMRDISAIESKAAGIVIVSCPTCYFMFTKVYPKLIGGPLPFEVRHYSEYLAEPDTLEKIRGLARGKTHGPGLGSGFEGNKTVVTYHDPCDLGRKLQITRPPRTLLENLEGVDFRELRFSGEESKCCGGGGNLEMVNPGLSQSIAAKRINDALEVKAEYLLSSCQQCKRTLQNAARKTRARIKVMDLIEFLVTRAEEADKEAAV